jgi:hypothetical protein
MKPDLRIQQAIVMADVRGVKVSAWTDGLDIPEVERIAVLFGQRPSGVACPLAHFACPFGKQHVAVVRVEDRPGPGDVLGFRFLILARNLYRHLGDPFAISDRYPPHWTTGTIPDLAWPEQTLPERTLEQLDAVLKNGDSPLLLGATQALVDGYRVLLTGTAPNESLARDLWHLLPDSNRRDLWPASFAFSNELGFHLAIGPTFLSASPNQGLNEEALRDYPPSNYELNLQIAVESGDRASLQKLLARRNADETIRLALYMIAFALLVAVVFRFVL